MRSVYTTMYCAIINLCKVKVEAMNHPDFSKYEITSDGKVFSLDYNHTGERREIRQSLKRGYPTVGIVNNEGIRKHRPVHRLVAETYIPNTKGKREVNHLDGIKANNDVSNLEWCTSSENQLHAFKVGLQKSRGSNVNGNSQGSKLPQSKMTEKIVEDMRVWHKEIKGLIREPWKLFGISRNTFWYAISETSKNRTWKHVPYPS